MGWVGIRIPSDLQAPMECSLLGESVEVTETARPERASTITRLSSLEPIGLDCSWGCYDPERPEVIVSGSNGLYEISGAPVFVSTGGSGLRSNALIVEDGTYSLMDFASGNEEIVDATWSTISVESGEEIDRFVFTDIERLFVPIDSQGLDQCEDVCLD